MNLPNKLTMLRILLVPVFVGLVLTNTRWGVAAGLAVFIVASLTDAADGRIARKRGLATDFGKFLDPLADKILVVAAMLWFVERSVMPAWVALIVIIREFMITGLRLVAIDNGRVIAAGLLGKIKTVVTMGSLTVMFLPLCNWMIFTCLVLITVTTLVSGVEYFVKNKDIINWRK